MNMKHTKDANRPYTNVHPASRKLWIFVVLGVSTIVLGLAIVGLYFNVQTVTTTTSLTEIIPTYIAGLGITFCGALNILLFWRRHLVLVFFEVLICVATGSVSAVSAILTGTHILQPIKNLESCSYDNIKSICACFSIFKRNALVLEKSETEQSIYTFERTSNCENIQNLLPILLYTQCALFTAVFVIAVACTVLAFLALRHERLYIATLQEETYAEIFTVSGSSCTDLHSDSEDDNTVGLNINGTYPNINGTYPKVNGQSSKLNGINPKANGVAPALNYNKTNGNIYAQPIGILKNSEKTDVKSFIENSNRLLRSKSCDSIDEIYAQSSKKSDGSSPCPEKGKSKLKEHRRRERRAVTLHNLDTKQLMSVLSLHMRYVEETRTLQSQGKLSATAEKLPADIKRRAITPQPYHLRAAATSTLPKTIRSHTPQPPRKKIYHDHYEEFYKRVEENENDRMIRGKENWRHQSVSPTSITSNSSFEQRPRTPGFQKPGKKKTIGTTQSLPGHRRSEMSSVEDDDRTLEERYVNGAENTDIPKRPKSRSSVQAYFLPPQPIHRKKSVTPPQVPIHRGSADKSQLPPQPLQRKTEEQKTQLPPNPVHRNSAFEVVGHTRVKTNPLFGREVVSHDTVLQPQSSGEITSEQAIRENFSLYASPFLFRNDNKPFIKPDYTLSSSTCKPEPPPPYAPPPTYADFMSLSQDERSSQSETVDDDSVCDSCQDNQNFNSDKLNADHQKLQKLQLQNMYKITENKRADHMTSSASDDDVFLPVLSRRKEVVSPVYSHVSKNGRRAGNLAKKSDTPKGDIGIMYNIQNTHQMAYGNMYANVHPPMAPQLAPVNHYALAKNSSAHWTSHNYEEIDDLDYTNGYEDSSSSCGMSSQASLLPSDHHHLQIRKDDGPVYKDLGLECNDPEVLETMI